MATSSADCEQMIPRSVTPVSCSARALCRMGFTKSANRRLKQWINSQLRWILWLSAFVTTYGLTHQAKKVFKTNESSKPFMNPPEPGHQYRCLRLKRRLAVRSLSIHDVSGDYQTGSIVPNMRCGWSHRGCASYQQRRRMNVAVSCFDDLEIESALWHSNSQAFAKTCRCFPLSLTTYTRADHSRSLIPFRRIGSNHMRLANQMHST